MAEIQFFGEVDLHPTKRMVSSEYPAWYFDRPLEQLGEEVGRMERQLDRGEIPQDRLGEFKDVLAQKKEQYGKITVSIPKLNDIDKDKYAKIRKELGKIIQSGYYTRSQMIKGTVDAHKEAERMVKPLVEVKPEFAEILQAARVKVENGRCSRDGIVKAWKILGKAINRNGGDEDTNSESLRRD